MLRKFFWPLAIVFWLLATGAEAQRATVEFVTPSIVHVVKGQPTKSLVVTKQSTMDNSQLTIANGQWKSSELTVREDAKGNLTFQTAKGRVLLREGATTRPERARSKAVQTFLLDKDEAIYGLGTIQNGKMNRRGEHKRMEQSNLEDFQNVLQSIKGWDSTGRTIRRHSSMTMSTARPSRLK